MSNEITVKLTKHEIELVKICLMIADLHNLERLQGDIIPLLRKFENIT